MCTKGLIFLISKNVDYSEEAYLAYSEENTYFVFKWFFLFFNILYYYYNWYHYSVTVVTVLLFYWFFLITKFHPIYIIKN